MYKRMGRKHGTTGSFKSVAWLQSVISQPPEQLETSVKHQSVPYQVQIYTYFFIIHWLSFFYVIFCSVARIINCHNSKSMGTKKINKCVLNYKTSTEFPLHQILSNSIENHQIWTKITNFGNKITKFNQNCLKFFKFNQKSP